LILAAIFVVISIVIVCLIGDWIYDGVKARRERNAELSETFED